MENVIVIYSDSSSDSIKEIEPPKKLPPPLIDIDADEMVLNVTKNTTQSIAQNFVNIKEIPQESPGDYPSHWTDDMKRFYNDDWGDEESFIVDKMQAKMDKHPYLWQVSERDLLARRKKKNYYLKCFNCCQYGHNMLKCPEPLHIPKCHMCGQAGHLDKTCPNSICLNCGNQMKSYVTKCKKCSLEAFAECLRCSLPGHHFINCSDHWRRYHSTIGKIQTDIPSQIIYKSASDVWCCNCGKRGHYELDCRTEKQLYFPETSPFVASYNNEFNAYGGIFSVPETQMLSKKNKIPKQRKVGKQCLSKNQKMKRKSDESLIKLQQAVKRKKKKKKKKEWKQLVQTPDFIPI